MKITGTSDTQLEVTNATLVLPGLLAVMGGGFLVQEVPKFLRGQEHITDYKSDIPIVIAVVFVLVGLGLLGGFRARFDRIQQSLTWRRIGILGVTTRNVPFGDIREARLERDPNQFVVDHPQRGPMVRLVIATSDGPLPMGALYTYSTKGMEKAAAAINAFIGRQPGEDAAFSGRDGDIRALVAAGSKSDAIALVRLRRGCSLAEAKRIVSQLEAEQF